MAMPTFDFGNILRRLTSLKLYGRLSTFPLFFALATAMGGVGTTLYNLFSDFNIPTIPDYAPDINFFHSGVLSLILYAIDAQVAINIANWFLYFIRLFIPFVITTLITYLTLRWVWLSREQIRKAVKDALG